jgi:hypothetical protein
MIDRLKCRFDKLIDQPYGFEYEIKDNQLVLNKPNLLNEDKNKVDIVKDNRNLLDISGNQKLSKEDIEQMKKVDDLSGKV